MTTRLSPRHERFALERARGKTLADAWELAGGSRSRSYACLLEKRPDISRRIRELLAQERKVETVAVKKATRALALDKEWVLRRLMRNTRRTTRVEKVTATGKRRAVEYRYDGAVANRALELIGKELGMFVERSENMAVLQTISGEPLTLEQWQSRHAPKALPATSNPPADEVP